MSYKEEPQKNALISVYNKDGIVDFARGLVELGWNVYASGGTARAISGADVDVTDVSKLVGGEAILGHRVVTLSREIYAGLLADKTKPQDMEELRSLGIPIIDLVCVDMYPLEDAIAKVDASPASVREQVDIGGPTLIRAAAKGERLVLSVPAQRQSVLDWLKAGMPDEQQFVDHLAARAEYEVTRYTMELTKYRAGNNVAGRFAWLDQHTKYGENPQQQPAGHYADNRLKSDALGLEQFEHVKGMDRSYINMTDVDRLLQTITHIAAGYEKNFNDVPAIAVGVKHGNACGAGVAETHVDAVKKMLEGDTRAIFGGVVIINGVIDGSVAEALMHHAVEGSSSRLLDAVIGASVSDEAIEILSRKKLRILVNPALENLTQQSLDSSVLARPVRGGLLAQPNYDFVLDFDHQEMKIKGKLGDQNKRDLVLAWAVGSTSNSNTISLVKDGKLIGNGVGQQDRVGAGQLALSRTTIDLPQVESDTASVRLTITLDKQKLDGSAAYSDSFFPFADGPQLLASAGVRAILSTSGSVRDDEVTDTLAEAGVATALIPDKIARGFFAH